MVKKLATAAVCAALAATVPVSATGAENNTPQGATDSHVAEFHPAASGKVSGQYVVYFRQGDVGTASVDAENVVSELKVTESAVKAEYRNLAAAHLELAETDIAALRRDPRVQSVHEVKRIGLGTPRQGATAEEPKTPWGIDRTDAVAGKDLDGSYTAPRSASNTNIYVVDTGVADHPELEGRVASRHSFNEEGDPADCDGHGTHVAATAAGKNVGVAPDAKVHAVQVLDCWGSADTTHVLAGLDWIAGNAAPNSVANMSFGGNGMTEVDEAATRIVEAGVTIAAASGNDGASACNASPARADGVISVASSTRQDTLSGFSNFGKCVDIIAPGDNILSADYMGGYVENSGTSMAAPHVAGAAALYLAAHPGATPDAVQSGLLDGAQNSQIGRARWTRNKLLNVNFLRPADAG